MVARRGRGAKTQAAKTKAQEEPEVQSNDVEENNGDAEQPEQEAQEQMETTSEEAVKEAGGGDAAVTEEGTTKPATEGAEVEKKEEEKEVVKIEPGKILVENLPPSYLFDYQDKLKELFSKHGEINNVKRGPMIVTELTTAPTLSAIVEFKNKDSVEKALTEEGTELDGHRIAVAVESRGETAVLVGVPYEVTTGYVRDLFSQCGEIAAIHEFSKNKYKILRVTFSAKEGVERALKLDRELRLNGFLVTVTRYRDNDEHKNQNSDKNKRSQGGNAQNRTSGGGGGGGRNSNRNSFSRPTPPAPPQFNNRPNFRGRGGGGAGRGGFARGGGGYGRGYPPAPAYLPPQGYLPPPQSFMNDGQRPNKRLRQM